jgi:hypothetical protein
VLCIRPGVTVLELQESGHQRALSSASSPHTIAVTLGCDVRTYRAGRSLPICPYILSVFFPTGYPDRTHPDTGLVASQQERLMTLVGIFPLYAEHTPEAKLVLRGYADPRGTDKYNMALSERRVAVVKAFLAAHGIPQDRITIEALGKSQELDAAAVAQLETENPLKAPDARQVHKPRVVWLAYNRRIDVEVQPVTFESSRLFPHPAAEANLLLQPTWPSLRQVKESRQVPAAEGVATGMLP